MTETIELATRGPASELFAQHMRLWGSCGWGRSWVRLNGHLAETLRLVITGGIRFGEDDFRHIWSVQSRGHIPGDVEDYHSLAVLYGNRSAADSIDRYLHRKPLSVGVRFPYDAGRNGLRRICVGSRLQWMGEYVTVTSFADDGESVIACAYQPHPNHHKVSRRFTITRKDLHPPKHVEVSP